MSNGNPLTNGTSKETLKTFLKVSAWAIGLLLVLNGFLAQRLLFGGNGESGTGTAGGEPNVQLLKMFKEQIDINKRLADSFEKSVEVQDDMKDILRNILTSTEATSRDLSKAMERQVTRKDLDALKERRK